MDDRKYRILIAEDDEDILQLLALYLKSEGFEVLTACNGMEAYHIVLHDNPDLGIFDIMMPELDGYELLVKTRTHCNMPVLFLSAKDSDPEKILGLDLGADDYISKPFNPLEVVARVHAALRRFYDLNVAVSSSSQHSDLLQAGDLSLNRLTFTVKKREQEIALTSTELKLLTLFMQHPGRVYTKKQLMEQINENYLDADINSIRVHISNLREKLGTGTDGDSYIKTVRELGYKFTIPE